MANLVRVIVLPGMDGTTELLEPFARAAAGRFECELMGYPVDRMWTMEDVRAFVRERVAAESGTFVLMGESYSSPIAIELAREMEGRLRALVLASAFASSPLRGPLRWSVRRFSRVWSRLPMPLGAIRVLLTGMRASRDSVRAVRRAVKRVKPDVLALRMRELMKVDVRAALAEARVPVLCVQPADDALVSGRCLREMVAANPRMDVRMVAGPHLLLQQREAEVVGVLEEWLEERGLEGSA